VGQRFVQLLVDHPWFEIVAVTGSERTSGGKYRDVCRWVLDEDIPESIGDMEVESSEPTLPARIVFSALPSRVARQIEPVFSAAGYIVCSNASAYRQEADVPLIIPEVNGNHLKLLERQRDERGWQGLIVTSPNCTASGLAMTLKPLDQAFGVNQVFVTTLQAVSGAGYPGIPYLDITDNVIPNISGEEDKIQDETRLLMGKIEGGVRIPAEIELSVQTFRVPVVDGHTLSIAVKFERAPTVEEAIRVLKGFQGSEQMAELPSAPTAPLLVRSEAHRPQPRKDRGSLDGMSVTVGGIRPCPVLDLRMVSMVHNTLRGAASGSILNAELLVANDHL
jgi:aspartate-semialdehyde dehydrogenase